MISLLKAATTPHRPLGGVMLWRRRLMIVACWALPAIVWAPPAIVWALPTTGQPQADVDTSWVAQLPAARLDIASDPRRLLEGLLEERQLDADASAKARIHLALGHRLRQAGSVDRALGHYRLASRLDPGLAEAHLVLGSLLGQRGQFRQAARAFAWVLDLDPGDIRGYRGRALALERDGKARLAKRALEEGLAQLGNDPELSNLLARLLATSRDAAVRDGARAIQLAQNALAARAQAPYAETLAMALAEAGRYQDAANVQRNLLQQARRSAADATWVAQLEQRLALYEAGKAWHQP